VLADAPPAKGDAAAIARLKEKGFIALGRTNMTEFAYSGVGLNPHYGTPLCAYDRVTGRIPGGSSSGAAISVADKFCLLGIGTDTGGSCRIPAAYNGIVGFKPTASRVPRQGCYPLSGSFDSIGPLATSVACCASADAIMSGDWDGVLQEKPLASVRALVLANFVLDGLAPEVAADFSRVLTLLGEKGMVLREVRLEGLEELPAVNSKGGIVAAEAYAHHAAMIAKSGEQYDPRVRGRIEAAAAIAPAELINAHVFRKTLQHRFKTLMSEADVIVLPTVANIAPPLAALAEDRDYFRFNAISLRNTYVFNFLDGCAISIPMHRPGTAPTGLMLAAPDGRDRELLAISAAIAPILG
jgi:aspartyl-tRNA(Asn)/glutamyl-tRNA(Gln) amidotransferase subunit A